MAKLILPFHEIYNHWLRSQMSAFHFEKLLPMIEEFLEGIPVYLICDGKEKIQIIIADVVDIRFYRYTIHNLR